MAGYFTEYSAMPFAYFFLGEYSSILLISTLTVILFLGGWLANPLTNYSSNILSSLVLGIKVSFIFFIFVWVRATFPRFKFDQLMKICWTAMLPLTLAFIIIIPAIIITFN